MSPVNKLLLLSVLLVFYLALAGCSVSNCPVAVGDNVSMADRAGEVRAVMAEGGWTESCYVGVLWADGDHTYEYGWALEVRR